MGQHGQEAGQGGEQARATASGDVAHGELRKRRRRGRRLIQAVAEDRVGAERRLEGAHVDRAHQPRLAVSVEAAAAAERTGHAAVHEDRIRTQVRVARSDEPGSPEPGCCSRPACR